MLCNIGEMFFFLRERLREQVLSIASSLSQFYTHILSPNVVECHNLQAVTIVVKIRARRKGTLIWEIKEASLMHSRKPMVSGCAEPFSLTELILAVTSLPNLTP
ncbi:hypothetical protein Tcan_00893, partial [Toxocara canis]